MPYQSLSSINGIVDKCAFLTCRLEEVCVPPEIFTAQEPLMQSLCFRLAKMDKLCQSALRKFKLMLPELEPKPVSERKEILNRILTK